jgi:hypothetical protein
MTKLYDIKTNVNLKTRKLCFTALLALFLVLSSVVVNVEAREFIPPTIVKSASPTSYSAVGQNITYTYNITDSGSGYPGPITVTDNITGKILILNGDLSPDQSITGTATYTITRADLDAGSVTNLAYIGPNSANA